MMNLYAMQKKKKRKIISFFHHFIFNYPEKLYICTYKKYNHLGKISIYTKTF